MTKEQGLRKVSQKIRRQQLKTQHDEELRNYLVHELLAEGWTHARLAEVTGLTRGRIGQIAMRR